MISEMLRTPRWFYVQEPVWPPGPRRRNSWYRKRALYAEIIAVVKGTGGPDLRRIDGECILLLCGGPHPWPLQILVVLSKAIRQSRSHVDRGLFRPPPLDGTKPENRVGH